MKTIVDNATNTSRYLLADDKPLNITSMQIEVGDPANLDFIIGDLNSSNATVIEGVTEPVDEEGNSLWFGCKYFCASDGTWTEDPNWVDPRIIEDDPNLD
jgi:hypothetical protein|tara:strand:- start:168 stop:467 length:300 start_codon:yes stop_codon:yes gene_type:complete